MCKSRKCPSLTLGVLSLITLLLGVTMIVLSFRFTSSGFSKIKGLGSYQNGAFFMLLAGAIVAVITGLCGMIVCFRKVHICFNITVGFSFMVALLLLLVNGIIIQSISSTPIDTLQKFCNDTSSDKRFIVRQLRKIIDEVDDTIGGLASQNMCSSVCPCKPTANDTIWTTMTPEALKNFNRTLPWNFAATNSSLSFDNFGDCMDAIISGN